MRTPRLQTVGTLALLLVCCTTILPPVAAAEWAGDYYILILDSTWTYQNADPPYDMFTESVFDYFEYEGHLATRIGEDWNNHTIAFSDGHTVTVYAEVDEGVLHDLDPDAVLGEFSDGMSFEICPGGECDTLMIRFWDALDPTLCEVYAIDPGLTDLTVVASYDRDYDENVHNAILAWNLPDGITPPTGAVTNIDWNQLDVGMVASRGVDAESGGLYDFYDLVDYVVAVGDHPDTPGTVVLDQNFPNPFNPATTIRYSLASTAAVSLTIHDAAGRLVRTLDGGTRREAGVHTVRWRGGYVLGRPQSAGTYFCHLRADGVARTTRTMAMTLVR